MSELRNKISPITIERVIKEKGYSYYTKGNFNLNIIGVRKNNKNKVTNKFDDLLVVAYNVDGSMCIHYYNITTEPGSYYMNKKLGNVKGTAILVPGQYKSCYAIGKHNGKYKALVQVKPVKVYRDNNKDDIYDMIPQQIDEGYFGINIHRSNPYTKSKLVNDWSAGCQVFADPDAFKSFMKLCEEQNKRFGNSFTYTLLDEKDFD